MNSVLKKVVASLLSLSLILCWAAFARDVKVSAGSYATASFVRIYGTDRYDTANKIAASGWTTSRTVVLASGMSYADALAGAPLAYALDAPVLLVSGQSVPESVMQQIYALGATDVVILGGTAAVSSSIESELNGKGFTVERIWGQTRYETAVRVAEKLTDVSGSSGEAFIVSGENYPDALAVSPVASLKGAPIVYSNKKGNIDSGSAALLTANNVDTAYVIGGTAAISDSVRANLGRSGVDSVTRISGNSRYETALKVADYFIDIFTTRGIAFATGENYPDALAGGVFAAKKGMPVLLTNSRLNAEDSSSIFLTASAYDDSRNFTENLVDFIERFQPEDVYVFGGEKAVPNVTIDSYFDGQTWEESTTTTTPSNPDASTAPLSSFSVGDHVYFGNYEMDGNTSNGAEAIEWRILDKENDRVLVLADHNVTSRPYHDTVGEVTWETASLRKWLNNDFYNTAFSSVEHTYILNSYVENNFEVTTDEGKMPYWIYLAGIGGNNTYDNIFLLNSVEKENYLGTSFTEAMASDKYNFGVSWYLRCPGLNYSRVGVIDGNGRLYHEGFEIAKAITGVRPAMWLEPTTPVTSAGKSTAPITTTTTTSPTSTTAPSESNTYTLKRTLHGVTWEDYQEVYYDTDSPYNLAPIDKKSSYLNSASLGVVSNVKVELYAVREIYGNNEVDLLGEIIDILSYGGDVHDCEIAFELERRGDMRVSVAFLTPLGEYTSDANGVVEFSGLKPNTLYEACITYFDSEGNDLSTSLLIDSYYIYLPSDKTDEYLDSKGVWDACWGVSIA